MDPSAAAAGTPDPGPVDSSATAKKKTVGTVLVGELKSLRKNFFSTLRETKVRAGGLLGLSVYRCETAGSQAKDHSERTVRRCARPA